MSLSVEALLSALDPDSGWSFEVHEEITSTSDLAKAAGMAGSESGLVITADSQTAGRGQRSNRWVTPRGLDLMFSVLLRPMVPMLLWPRLTTLAALSVCRGIEDELALSVGIKWPNDIYCEGKKLSGLLAETTVRELGSFIVLGIGINVNTTDFPAELAESATSLKRQTNTPVPLPRETILAAVLNQLSRAMRHWDEGFEEILREVRDRSILIGKNVRAMLEGKPVFGRVRDLDHEGHLVLEHLDGSTQILSSAAEVRPMP